MEPVAISLALLAVVMIVARIPILLAPRTSMQAYMRFMERPIGGRIVGALLAALAAALILTAPEALWDHSSIASLTMVLGWLLAGMAAWLLVAPGSYARFASSFMGAIDEDLTVRVLAALGIWFGLALAWIAFTVL